MSSSLRARLLALLLVSISTIWLAGVMLGYQKITQDINTLFDANLAQMATSLLETTGHELLEEMARAGRFDVVMEVEQVHPEPEMETVWREVAFQVWVFGESLAMRSANAPDEPIGALRDGFSYTEFDQRRWRVYVRSNSSDSLQVVVAEEMSVRDALGSEFTQNLLSVSLLLLVLAALLIWFSIGRGLLPLRRLAREVAARHPHNLQQIALQSVPREVGSLVGAMNGLFALLEHAFENERRFTADAAHELRTPLAALKTHLDVAQMTHKPEVRERAMAQAMEGVGRSVRLVEQLLTLARLDPDTGVPDGHVIDLVELSSTLAHEMQPADQAVIEVEAPEAPLWVHGNALYLEVLVRNLLDNALRYGGGRGPIHLGLTALAGEVELRVEDAGSGVSEAERGRIMERFYRVLGSEASGSGLGLSIVKRISELHQGYIELDQSSLGGLLVRIRFPRLAEPDLDAGD